jgi:23S rRNA pseudouridine955/2504/2580 synthase
MREIVVPTNETTKKLGNFLKREFPIGYLRKVFRKNSVRINGRRAKAQDLVKPGDRVQLYLPFEEKKNSFTALRKETNLEVVFEDEALLVINKPAGLAVHEGKTVSKSESLLGLLERRYRESAVQPRLVHRLDKDTTGLLIVAKSQKIADDLMRRFESGDVDKEYLCMIVGRLPGNEGKIDFPLPGREGNPVRALTQYRVLKRFTETTLVRVTIGTGRLHQIRLHFAKLGYPVVMDDQHGDFGFNRRFQKEYGLKRQFLHAASLKLEYGGKLRDWSAPVPKDLQQSLTKLESSRPWQD